MHETNLAQRGSLPLPSAALVIDMRGTGEDDVMDRLRVEVVDLAGEMKVHDLHHWRFLTEFLSFQSIQPLRIEDVDTIRSQPKPQEAQQATGQAKASSKAERKGLTGRVDPASQNAFFSSFQDDQGGLINEARPFNIFQQRIEELTQEIDRIRNNRIAAVGDLNKSGIAGRSVMDATVRIIFLTEASSKESLISAATYAARLKDHFRKLERAGHQTMVSTTVICLDNRGEIGPPSDLIQGLRYNKSWEHIDSLILSEQYREDAALIAGTMQTYLAELLLYVLLIIPPLRVSTQSTTGSEISPVLMIERKGENNQQQGEWVNLPPTTYLIGMAAIEHSARWGRRWINYGLITQGIETLQNRTAEDDLEQRRIKNVVEAWLSDWRAQVAGAIPERIPGNIQALQAIPNAIRTARPAEEAFTTNRFNFGIGETTLGDLEEYLANVKRTYIIPLDERAELRQEAQAEARSKDVTLPPTLQDAIDSIPLIQQRLREWEDRDPALKKGTPLVNAQLEAQRILSSSRFFTGATGAVPRARIQLKELSTAISDFQNNYQRTTLDLMDKRVKLEKRGRALIDELKKDIERIPFLGTVLHLARPMAWLTFALLFCLVFLGMLLGVTWLEHLINYTTPDNVSFVVDTILLPVYPTGIVFWIVVIALIIAGVVIFGRTLLDKQRPAWSIEVIFWLVLLVSALSGLLPGFSITQLTDDPESLLLLSWLPPLPYWSGIFAIVLLVMVGVEGFWFRRWIMHLMEERDAIINDLRNQHRGDVDEVTHYIADTVALQLLRRTGLTDGKGGPGSYYDRVDLLQKRLVDISVAADYQQKLAANRLVLSLSETQPGAATNSGGAWLNLKIREEWLDVKSLANGYKRLKEHLGKEAEELKEFSELLLRIMGEETPIEIEQQFRDKPFTGTREQHQAQVLIETLAAMAMRFSVAPQSVSSMTPIIERYENIDNQYVHQLPTLNALIETLGKKVSEATIQPLLADSQAVSGWSGGSNPNQVRANTFLATDAFATWVQMLWDHRDPKLEKALTQSGVLSKLMEDDEYDARAVMRRLQTRTSLFGRSIPTGQLGELYLVLSPSTESRLFRQSLNIPSRLIIDFPDTERLLLLYIQRYVAEPLFIPNPELETDDTQTGDAQSRAETAHDSPDTVVQEEDLNSGVSPNPHGNGSSPDPQVTNQPPAVTIPADQIGEQSTTTTSSNAPGTNPPSA